jgi:hypothetical protein
MKGDPTMATTDALINIRQTTLAALRVHVGQHWQVVLGELQLSHNEMPTWILLYEDSDLKAAHQALCDVLVPFMEQADPVQFTVSYTILTDALDITVETLMDNDDIKDALNDPGFGTVPDTSRRQANGIFGAALSGLRPKMG